MSCYIFYYHTVDFSEFGRLLSSEKNCPALNNVVTIINCYFFSRGYVVDDGWAEIPIDKSIFGDVTLMVYHARSTFGGKVQGKVGIHD